MVTRRCNLRCTYCYGDPGIHGGRETMSREVARRAVDWLLERSGAHQRVRVDYFGGEPLLEADLVEDVTTYAEERAAATGKRISFQLTTNGTLLDDGVIAFAAGHGIEVGVSLDGPREVHDRQRPLSGGGGSCDGVLSRAKALLAALPRSGAGAVLLPGADVAAVGGALRAAGFARISLTPASPPIEPAREGPLPPRDVVGGLVSAAESEAPEWAEAVARRDAPALRSLRDHSALAVPIRLALNDERRTGCGAGRGMVAVAPDGSVYLCHRLVGHADFRLGSVDSPVLDRETFLRAPEDRVPQCRTCVAGRFCPGGCSYDNLAMTGSPDRPPEDTCALARRLVELAATIVAALTDADRAWLRREDIVAPPACPLDLFSDAGRTDALAVGPRAIGGPAGQLFHGRGQHQQVMSARGWGPDNGGGLQ